MVAVYLQIWFEGDSLFEAGIYGRSAIEDPLEEALKESKLGEVYGGGGGERGSEIAIEIKDERKLKQALSLIRKTLREQGAPASTQIIRDKPIRTIYVLNDEQ